MNPKEIIDMLAYERSTFKSPKETIDMLRSEKPDVKRNLFSRENISRDENEYTQGDD